MVLVVHHPGLCHRRLPLPTRVGVSDSTSNVAHTVATTAPGVVSTRAITALRSPYTRDSKAMLHVIQITPDMMIHRPRQVMPSRQSRADERRCGHAFAGHDDPGGYRRHRTDVAPGSRGRGCPRWRTTSFYSCGNHIIHHDVSTRGNHIVGENPTSVWEVILRKGTVDYANSERVTYPERTPTELPAG